MVRMRDMSLRHYTLGDAACAASPYAWYLFRCLSYPHHLCHAVGRAPFHLASSDAPAAGFTGDRGGSDDGWMASPDPHPGALS